MKLQFNQRDTCNAFYKLLLQSTNFYRFVQYTPRKVFNSLLQSVVDAKRAGDENSLSGVVA